MPRSAAQRATRQEPTPPNLPAPNLPAPKSASSGHVFDTELPVDFTQTPAGGGAHAQTLRTALIIAVLVGCVGLNIFGNTVTEKFGLALFLDMVGTATAAFALSPWYGAAVGLATNVLVSISGSPESLAFAPVNIVGALVWGYGFRRFGRGPVRFILLNLAAGLACTFTAVPITVFLFDGSVAHASNTVIAFLGALGHGMWVAVLSANLLSSLTDKLLSGTIALFAARILQPLGLRERNTDTRDPRRWVS